MKIKNISCTQFAGIRDRSISFEDGINVIYGKNESGKSTIVNLISRTLFQNARIDGRRDKEFRDLYFPCVRRGSTVTGDFADGKISFETEDGTYTLSKEWGQDPRCMLSAPDGVVRDIKTINDILKSALLYGEGVYSDMLFSSQRNTDISLQTILDASKKTDAKQEVVDAVSQAFSESDGISVDAIEQAINDKIDEIAGKHWDFEREMPVRKTGRWSVGLGSILKAYYDLEDAIAVLEEISSLEIEADRTSGDYAAKDTDVRILEAEYESFNTFASRLAVQSERKKAADRLEKELGKYSDILFVWPVYTEDLEKAKILQNEKISRELIDRYEKAKSLFDELKELEGSVENVIFPSEDEIARVKTAQRNIVVSENKLCGMNLNAVIKMLGGNEAEIRLLRTGELVDIADGNIAVTEAVSITVPGVIEMRLSPADVDVTAIEAKIRADREFVETVFEKYKADSIEELEGLLKKISDTKMKMEAVSTRLSILLGATAFEELEKEFHKITSDVRDKEDIDREIAEICKGNDIARYITAKETVIGGYISEYGSVEGLKAKAYDTEKELGKIKEATGIEEDIPKEYLDIAEPQAHLETLQRELKQKREKREEALTAKTSAVSRLESFKENISGEPSEDVQRAERVFTEQKSLLKHWLHINEVFKAQKEKLHDSPVQDIADSFTHYLDVISGGKVFSELPDGDKLNINIYSDNRLIDYSKLSEGTKETVSLAFRLAVLDHLFPNGGGVIVLDDPFTDMDAERTAQSCRLIKECALRHQVIFLTCREDYVDMLGGNNIFV